MPRRKPFITLPPALITLLRLFTTLQTPPSIAAIEPSYHTVRQQQTLALLAKHFGKNPKYPGILLGKSLLDVGCGTAPVGCYMALAGADVTAIDPDRASLDAAKAYAESFGTPLNFLNLRAEQLLTNPTRYNIILALDVLAGHPQPGKLMWVLHQLLTPGGILVVGHTTRSLRAWLVHRLFSQIILKRTTLAAGGNWHTFHTPAQLGDLAQAAGLQAAGLTMLRYSINGVKWKSTQNRRLFTRFLAAFKAA